MNVNASKSSHTQRVNNRNKVYSKLLPAVASPAVKFRTWRGKKNPLGYREKILLRQPNARDLTLILTFLSGINDPGLPLKRKEEHKSLMQYFKGTSESVNVPIFPTYNTEK